MIQKLRQWMKKWSFGISLLLSGIIFFTWTDNWQIYTEPVQEAYTRGVQTAQTTEASETSETSESADMAEEPETTAETEVPEQATTEAAEGPQEIVYHSVDDSYFDDAVFIGDSRTVGMYEYSGLEETSTFYASTGLTIYKMFDSAIVSVPGQKKKITVEEALSEKQFA